MWKCAKASALQGDCRHGLLDIKFKLMLLPEFIKGSMNLQSKCLEYFIFNRFPTKNSGSIFSRSLSQMEGTLDCVSLPVTLRGIVLPDMHACGSPS
ncbi:uncharacterized protein LOC105164249 isoform X2 [Sesamum indicum]|uniref:Uncharacterized protein LOC105164249 isoform X2 n=1 Tax=Sesamum indicum TaxID=4182 RepID=A0A8M8UTU9_SESIN|nr:uncharacterized protein LOC105164249 isoform X2 [Sesamum indicum]